MLTLFAIRLDTSWILAQRLRVALAKQGEAMDTTGRFVRYRLSSRDPEAARAFYRALFGWTAAPNGCLAVQGRPMFEVIAGEPAAGWTGHIAVDDLDGGIAIATGHGGAVRAPAERASGGRIGHVTDTDGVALALFQGSGPGEILSDEDHPSHGMPAWNVLVTHNPEDAVRFYVPLCGWVVEEIDLDHELLGTYYVADRDGQAVAGIIRAPGPHITPHWCLCMAVDNLDETLVLGRSLGAQVVREPLTIAEVGTYAVLEDLDGTRVGALRWHAQRRPW